MAEVEKEVSNIEAQKCRQCGADMRFSPKTQRLECEHCGSTLQFEVQNTYEKEFENLTKQTQTWDRETVVYRCENCGASSVMDKKEIATLCPFCGTSKIVKTEQLAGLKPDTVVPYKITKEQAYENYMNHIRKKRFTVGIFKRNASPDDINGIFNPAFTFDTKTVSSYSGTLTRQASRTVRDANGNTRIEYYTEFVHVSGTINETFDDILIQASNNIDQKTIDKLQPFNTNGGKAYSAEFLQGYTATQFSKDGMQCWAEAKRLIDRKIQNDIVRKHNCSGVSSLNVKTTCNNLKYKYILLPVYVGHTTWKQKLYNFFINGFSGKVVAKTPISKLKVTLLVLGIFAGIGAIVTLYTLFGPK